MGFWFGTFKNLKGQVRRSIVSRIDVLAASLITMAYVFLAFLLLKSKRFWLHRRRKLCYFSTVVISYLRIVGSTVTQYFTVLALIMLTLTHS